VMDPDPKGLKTYRSTTLVETDLKGGSVADPDPYPYPYVFGPPGSGSISTRYGLKNDANVASKSKKKNFWLPS
jgi:hypothetical protein